MASATLFGLCSKIEGNWYLLDFFAVVPWLLVLDRTRTAGGAAASGLAMSVGYALAVTAWFGVAMATYADGNRMAGMAVLVVTAPLLEPQFMAFAIVRHLAGNTYGAAMRALIGACAWVATEWLFPKLLADTVGQGLYPSRVLRQAADIAGIAGLTFLVVLINECVRAALPRHPPRKWAASLPPLAAAAAIVAFMAGYGAWRLEQVSTHASGEQPLRIGLVQSNIAAYDRLRREMGMYEAVRHVVDTHFSMSREAVDDRHVDALVWSETVYPTTFGKPKSETGGEIDREISDFVSGLGVPLIFGSYDRDEEGEYNAAVFLEPGVVGGVPRFEVYRKSRLFFLTEYLPAWMEGPRARAWMPWAGTWKPGPGARVFPLRVAGGRSVPVLPMICLEDVDTSLAVDGARLGAQLIVTMSNDSWFTEAPRGAHLHLMAAAFRSIETRLPQLRVTANGISAVVDASGEVIGGAGMGERSIVVGEVAPRVPPRTLVVAWGDWLGPLGLVLVLVALGVPLLRRRT